VQTTAESRCHWQEHEKGPRQQPNPPVESVLCALAPEKQHATEPGPRTPAKPYALTLVPYQQHTAQFAQHMLLPLDIADQRQSMLASMTVDSWKPCHSGPACRNSGLHLRFAQRRLSVQMKTAVELMHMLEELCLSKLLLSLQRIQEFTTQSACACCAATSSTLRELYDVSAKTEICVKSAPFQAAVAAGWQV